MKLRRAMHIRTGPGPQVQRVDSWLDASGVETARYDDVLDAAAHLVKHYEQVSELALIGATWLMPDEFGIVRCLRETWPHVAIVVYALEHGAILSDPLTVTCAAEADLAELLAQTPADAVQRIRANGSKLWAAVREARRSGAGTARAPHERAEPPVARPAAGTLLRVAPAEPGRPLLTAEELSALLDASEN